MELAVNMKRPATYQDLVDLPENMVGEIIDGELYAFPRPAARHSRATSKIGGKLDGPFDEGRGGPGGWIFLVEPELHLTEQVIVPDLAGWRRDRTPSLPDAAYISIPPDWVAEVLSPSTARIDRLKKLPIYANWNVGYVWLVDPITQIVESYRFEQGRWLLLRTFNDEKDARIEPFDAIEFDVTSLWSGIRTT